MSTTDSERTIRTMQAAMHVLFVVLLVVGVIRALAGDASPFAVIAATVVFTGVYLSGLVVERRARRAQSLRAAQDSHTGQVWIIALTLAWCLTLAIAPDFAWVAFALYFLVLHVAIRPIAAALVPLVLVASVAALVSRPDGRNVGTVIGPIMGMIVALGISWVLFTQVLGFEALDVGTPLLAFLFLVALGVDYNIFLVTRAREESLTHGPREGMLRALGATGGVITSAGILLAAVFAVLGVLPLVVLAQLGVIVCIGVLLDTLVVRTMLVPSLALVLGEKFWWPRRLTVQAKSSAI